MITNGSTRVCGLLAYPVEHSLSPLMQNYYAERMGIDLTYVPFKTEPERLGDAVRGAYAMNILGLNVTVPHKQAVLDYLKSVDEDALKIGAVNTLVRVEGGFKGYNTDAGGLRRAMQEDGILAAGRPCILLGAGGAAKAAAYLLAQEGAAVIYCLNRSQERAAALAEDMNQMFGRAVMRGLPLEGWREIRESRCLAVQTTSVGMYPHTDAAVIEEPEFFEKTDTVIDVIYTPEETRFLKLAKQAGARTANGLGMLIYQGVIAFELWNPGVRLPAEIIQGAREQVLKALGGRQ